MTTSTHPTPHPLAVEAAKELFTPDLFVTEQDAAEIIHTTAIEPVITQTEQMIAEISALIGYCQSSETCRDLPLTDTWRDGLNRRVAEADKAIAQWRTLTAPLESNLRPPEGSRSGFEQKSGTMDDKERAGAWRATAESLARVAQSYYEDMGHEEPDDCDTCRALASYDALKRSDQ